MEDRNILNHNLIALSLIVFVAAFSRVIHHEPNFSVIGALALFSGSFFANKWLRFFIPLSAMFLSDMVLGFHATMPFVYGAFIVITLMGTRLSKDKKVSTLLPMSLASSILFFLVTNFGSWLVMDMYTKNLPGLISAYYNGIPFFRDTVTSDLIYSFIFIYGFRFLEKHSKLLGNVYNRAVN